MFAQAAKRRRSPLRKVVLATVLVVAALGGVLAAAVWFSVRGPRSDVLAARSILLEATSNPASLGTAEGRAATRAGIDRAIVRLEGAGRDVRRSAPLRLAAALPFLGSQRDGLVGLIADSQSAAITGRDVFLTLEEVSGNSQIRGGRVPLPGLQQVERVVDDAGSRMAALVRGGSGLWGPLADARRQFDELAASAARRLDNGADALGVARRFLGEERDRRYFVALQNNAEMRDQGMVLSYSIASFSGGGLTFEPGGSIFNIRLDSPTDTPLPPGTEQVFGSIAPTQTWQSVNATADFPWSARAMADMYAKATGTKVDGVIAVDVPGLAALLRVVGPVTVEGLTEPITHLNVARIVLRDFYEGVRTEADNLARRERQSDVTRAIIERLTQGERDPLALGQHLGGAAAGGHLRLWSADQSEEEVFERIGLGGGPATEMADRTFHVAVENRTATKLDYYIRPRVRQDVFLTEAGDAFVRTTVTVENPLPADLAPSFAVGPDQQMERPGEYRAWLLLWSPVASEQPGAVPESGLQLSQHVIVVNPGETKELTFLDTVIPDAVRDGQLQLRLVPQSRLEPVPLEVRLDTDGWDVEGPRTISGLWDKVRILTWKVHR